MMIFITKKNIIDRAAGIRAAKESITAGGTPSGSFITSFLFIAQAKIFTARIATIIDRKIPAVPKFPKAKPRNTCSEFSTFTKFGCLCGVTIKKDTRATVAADTLSARPFSRA